MSTQAQRRKRIADGVCKDCGDSRVPGRVRCAGCIEIARIKMGEHRGVVARQTECAECGRGVSVSPSGRTRAHIQLTGANAGKRCERGSHAHVASPVPRTTRTQ